MMKQKYYLPIIFNLLLLGCDDVSLDNQGETKSSEALDDVAITSGILPDPDNIKLEGYFETRSDIGTDKFCAISNGENSYNIGVLAVFGADSKCEGRGEARLKEEKLSITLNVTSKNDSNIKTCEFVADYDGMSLQFPGILPQECSKFCYNRASLSGTHYFLVEQGNVAARQSNGRELKPLCEG